MPSKAASPRNNRIGTGIPSAEPCPNTENHVPSLSAISMFCPPDQVSVRPWIADSIPSVTISELSLRYPTRKPMIAPRHSVSANIATIANSGPSVSCRSSTTMVENDIIDPTDRSRLPEITTKVTPSAITPRMADERTTLNMLSTVRNFGLASVKPTMNSTNAIRIPCLARNVPIFCLFMADGPPPRSPGEGPARLPVASVMALLPTAELASDQRHASVDHDDLAGHVVAVPRGEERRRSRDVGRHRDAALEDLGRELLHRLPGALGRADLHQVAVHLFPHLGGHHAGREARHRDTMPGEVARPRLR